MRKPLAGANAAALNPHGHAVFLDGVWASGAEGTLRFHQLPLLSSGEVSDLMQAERIRIIGWLERHGVFDASDELSVVSDESRRRTGPEGTFRDLAELVLASTDSASAPPHARARRAARRLPSCFHPSAGPRCKCALPSTGFPGQRPPPCPSYARCELVHTWVRGLDSMIQVQALASPYRDHAESSPFDCGGAP